jgi:hypothetical protein
MKGRQNTEIQYVGKTQFFLNINPGGKYFYHWALKDSVNTLILVMKFFCF